MPPLRWWIRAVPAGVLWLLAYVYLTTPDVRPLATTIPATTAFMDLRAEEARHAGVPPRRVQRWVPYGRISATLKQAVLVAEDSAFWQHEGLDLEQIKESMEINLERMEFVRGASTITQQLAKNLYLSPSKNPLRKVRELLITRRLEAVLSKRRIFELYLNLIEWGNGIWGAEAAARTYFRKPAAALDAGESALLAGAIINPRVLNPGAPSRRLRWRQQLVLRRMGLAQPPPDQLPAAPPDTKPADVPSSAVPTAQPGVEGTPVPIPPTSAPEAPDRPPR